MRLPNRKPGKYTFPTFDLRMTQEKLNSLKEKLQYIQEIALPKAVKETRQYGENGDFSENAEYQIAKGRLRGLLRAQDELNYQINNAEVVKPTTNTDTVQIGHEVTTAVVGQDLQKTFTILGSSETNPAKGIISYTSPLGAALVGHSVGDVVTVHMADRDVQYEIIAIQ